MAFQVFPCNWDAIVLFMRVNNQWLRAGMTGIPTGINHAVVWPVMEAMGRPLDLTLFDQFRVMESAAIPGLQTEYGNS